MGPSFLFLASLFLTNSVPATEPTAPALAQTASQRASLCHADEVPLFTCKVGRKLANVCAGEDSVSYRFGKPGKTPELSINSAPDWSNVRTGTVVGGGGGQETHIRFTRGDYHYVVFEGYPGQYHDTKEPWAGLTVYKGSNLGRQVADHSCAYPAATTGWSDEVSKRAPDGINITEPEDSIFDAWY